MDFQSDADLAETCREISAPQLDQARNVQFRHFPIDRERRDTVLEGQHCHTVADGGRRDILLSRVKSSIFKPTKLISLSKCPVFPTNALFFNLFVRSKSMMLKLPVEETKKATP